MFISINYNLQQDISLETTVDPQRGLSVRVTSTVAEQGQVDTGDSQHSQVSCNYVSLLASVYILHHRFFLVLFVEEVVF